MRIKLDENLPIDAVELLRAGGHDATSAFDQGLAGSTDQDLIRTCSGERRALISLDTDFADIRRYPPQDHAGLIVLRVRRSQKTSLISCLRRLLPTLSSEPVAGCLWIVEEQRIRIRGSTTPAD